MESTVLGLVLDSSAIISAERKKRDLLQLLDDLFLQHGNVELALSPITVAELVHGVQRAN